MRLSDQFLFVKQVSHPCCFVVRFSKQEICAKMSKAEVESPRLFASRNITDPMIVRFTRFFPVDRKQKTYVPTQEGITTDASVVYQCAFSVKNELLLSGEQRTRDKRATYRRNEV